MEKYIGTYKDGHKAATWAIDKKHATLHLKDKVRLHGALVNVEKVKKNEKIAA